MAGRKVFNEQDARRCIAAARATRGGIAVWARAHGVDGRSLNAWYVNLARRGVPRVRAIGPRLVEVVSADVATTARAPYVLHVGGVELEVGDHFDEQSLRSLLSVLKSC
jgi:hypothetical protein